MAGLRQPHDAIAGVMPVASSVPRLRTMVVIVVAIFFVASYPPAVLFALFCCYAVSGYLYWAWRRWRGESNPARPAPRVGVEAPPKH